MKNLKVIGTVFASIGLNGLCMSAVAMASTTELPPLMHKNFQALVKLQPYVVRADKFTAEKNDEEIKDLLKDLVNVGKTLPQMVEKERPGLKAISQLFSQYIESADKNFSQGYKDFARLQVRTITGFCMACHTSTTAQKQFLTSEDWDGFKDLTILEKADFYSATRQFDKALAAYENFIFQKDITDSNERQMISSGQAIRRALNILIRVKNDPASTAQFLGKVSKLKASQDLFEKDVQQWSKDVSDWSKEKSVDSTKLGLAELNSRIEGLIKKARSHQMFPADHSGEVPFLRASVLAHIAMNRAKTKEQQANSYYYLGQAYGALTDSFLWELDGLYFEACIRTLPHSELSKKCFKQLASEVYLGFSGSSGVNIPEGDLSRLSELRKLAQ